MKIAEKLLALLALLFGFTGFASAQVTTGMPPFGSFGGGPADTINLANLNVHLSVTVVNKAGRGTNFTYTLGYDSSTWYPVGASGSQTWEPIQNWGWIAQTQSATGYITYRYEYAYPIPCGPYSYGAVIVYSNFSYIDPWGVTHSIPNAEYASNCGESGATGGVASDGSGYSLVEGSRSGAPYLLDLYNSGGKLVNAPEGASGGAAGFIDSNGNEITVSGSGVFTDTLGLTALTVAGSGTPASPNTFTYTAPSGANAAYTMKYTSYTVRTNFGCSGIAEFGSNGTTTENLVSEIDLPDGTKYTFTYEPTPGYSGDVTGRLASVTLPTGGTISYSYSGGSNGITCADGSAATLTRYTPDTGTAYWTYAHTESGTAWSTKVTDPQGNQSVMNFQGIYATETQVYQGTTSGTLLQTTYACYNGSSVPCNSTAVTQPITQISAYTLWPGGLESEINTDYDKETSNGTTTSYGLLTEKDEYAYGSGAPGSLVRKTLTSYATLTNNILNRPASVTVEDGSGNVKAKTTYCYDEGIPSGTTACNVTGAPTATSGTPQHLSVTGSRGNATTIASLVSGSTTLGQTSTYYDTGNVNVATDVNGAQTTYSYVTASCGNSFVTSISEPLSLSQSMTWNCTGGVQTSATDENGKTTSTAYTDAYFWRPSSTTDQLSNVTNITYSGQTSVESTLNFNGTTSTSDTLTTLDGLGRSHLSQVKEGQSSTTYDSSETDYDSLGRPSRTTLPYAGAAGQTNSSAPSTTTTYDALSRPTLVTDSGGGQLSYTYSQNDTYEAAGPEPAGENTKRKQLEYDALGRLTSVCEVTSATGSGTCAQTASYTGYWTKYTYDLNNNLTGVTQNAQSPTTQTRTYTYDDLGRMTSETNPETGNAAVSYTYDSDATCLTSKGDPVKKVDAAGDTICATYDALHRMTSNTYSGTYASVTPNRYFVYDSETVDSVAMVNAKTRLAEAYTCFSPCSTKLTDEGFSYTARGEASDLYESTPHSGSYYHPSQGYWANGTISQVGNNISGLPAISYDVDGEGRISSATASSGQNPLSSTTYNVASLPLQVNLGSSDSDSFTYDPNTNRMTNYTFSVNGQSVVGNLKWNPLGTLLSLTITDPFNTANAQTCSYVHDDLVRIGSSINPSTTPGVNCVNGSQQTVWSQIFTYDAFGNIQKSGSSSFGATYSTSTNQMTMIGSSTPTYDANGNVTNDFLNTFAWDANGRPVTADSVGLSYDALGRMVEQNRSGSYTEIAYAPSGAKIALMSGSTLQKGVVPLTGGAVAVYTPSGAPSYYRHSDWIGSSRFASTSSRTMYFDGAYGPFGEPYAQTGTTDLSFTSMNQDTASNLYDFPAREYGTQGRWPSPDPAGISAVNPGNPQSWNRYAYALNSPLLLTDPTGNDPGDDCDDMGLDPTWACAIPQFLGGGGGQGSGYEGGCSNPAISDLPGCQPFGAPGICDPSTSPFQCGLDSSFGPNPCARTNSQGIPNCIARPQGVQPPQTAANNKPGFWSCTFSAGPGAALGTTALDAIGIIPGGGNVLHGVQLAAGVGALGLSLGRASFNDVAVGGATTGLAFADAAGETTNIAIHGVEVVPILGNFVSGVATVNDIFGKEGVISSYKACFAGGR